MMKLTVWLGLLAAFVPAEIHAQEIPRLTLDEAIAVARLRNPGTLSALAQVDVAELDARARFGSFLPNLSASMDWGASSRTQLTGSDDFGRTVTLPAPLNFRSSNAGQRVNGSVRLFDGLQNVNRLRAAREGIQAAHAGVEVQYLQVEADVAQRFYDALRFERLIQVEQELLTSALERLDANERLFRVAAATQVDVLGAQVDVAGQEQALERQRGESRKARLRVLESLGILDETTDFVPVGSFPGVFDPGAIDVEMSLSTALQKNPTIAQRTAEFTSARLGATAARGSWMPTIDLSGGWSRGLNEQQFGAFFDVNPNQDRGYAVSMSVSWPIFNGFQRSQQIGQANAQRRQAEENLRLNTLLLEQQVRGAHIDLQNRYDGFLSQQRSTALSRTRVDLARQQYLTGAISFTNLQQIIQSAANEERGLVDAEYNFAVAVIVLEQLVGEPVTGR